MRPIVKVLPFAALMMAASAWAGVKSESTGWTADERKLLASLTLAALPALPDDPSNRVANDSGAAALGKRLFFDTKLSRNDSVSCGSCHQPDRDFQDGTALGHGVGTTGRRTMPIAGTAYAPFLFWDGRRDSQWSQALGPLESAVEHGGDRTQYARYVAKAYKKEFERVFGRLPDVSTLPAHASPSGDSAARKGWAAIAEPKQREISQVYASIGKAIAAFERQIAFIPSRFDRYVAVELAGAAHAPADRMTSDEVAGLRLFIGKANCVNCHNGARLTDDHFHNTGVPGSALRTAVDSGRTVGARDVMAGEFNCLSPYSDARPEQCSELRFAVTDGKELVRAFKTPSLRNVAGRAPYMHAGQIGTLSEVIAHYDRAPRAPFGDTELKRLKLTVDERRQIEAFLRTLSSATVAPPNPLPSLPQRIDNRTQRPLVAIIADAGGTELTDFVIPHAVLNESGAARVLTVAMQPGRIRLRPGSVFIDPDLTTAAFDAANPQGADYVVVPALIDHENAAIAVWIRAQAARGATIVSICEGARTLANTGLLDGRRATSHWSSLRELAAKYPKTTWVRNQRYVVDDHLITTTGVSAALPASLYLVERIAGRAVADSVARRVGVASWEPTHDTDAFNLTRWMLVKAVGNTIAPWRHDAIGVAVADGVDEIALALTIDAISRSIRGKAFTWSDTGGSVIGRQGLRMSVDRPRFSVAPATRQMALPDWPEGSAGALDLAIARLTTWYGGDAAELIALGMEYTRARP